MGLEPTTFCMASRAARVRSVERPELEAGDSGEAVRPIAWGALGWAI